MKNLNKFMLLFCLSAVAILCTGCQKDNPDSNVPAYATEPEIQDNPEAESESESGSESESPILTKIPFPEADRNAVNFNDGNHAFVKISDTSAKGELSVEHVDENFMLKFTDLSTNSGNSAESVQEIQISAGQLLNPDQLESVRKIGFDLYQPETWTGVSIDATTFCADGTAYEFGSISGDENFCHVELEFLLAESGKCWDSSVQDANVIVMRRGMQDSSDFYLDNLVFYDVEGNSIPLHMQEIIQE